MSSLVYTRYELLRTLRNRRFFLLSLGFPLVLFFVIAWPAKGWIVIFIWTVVLGRLAARAYRRDTGRV